MKNVALLIIFLLVSAYGVSAQRITIGEKGPDVKISQWIDGREPKNNKLPLYVEFYVPGTPQSSQSVAKAQEIAARYEGKINVVLITRENSDEIRSTFVGKKLKFSVGIDDAGKTFDAYKVKYVPFSVLLDAKGKLMWQGNSSTMNNNTLESVLQ